MGRWDAARARRKGDRVESPSLAQQVALGRLVRARCSCAAPAWWEPPSAIGKKCPWCREFITALPSQYEAVPRPELASCQLELDAAGIGRIP